MSVPRSPTPEPPAPLEWHPAYRDRTWLLDWLEDPGHPYGDHVRLPIMRPLTASFVSAEKMYPTDAAPRTEMLTRRRCAGPAPYVGRPFRYEWWAAEDTLGRWIAGDSRIVYLPPSIHDPATWETS